MNNPQLLLPETDFVKFISNESMSSAVKFTRKVAALGEGDKFFSSQ